jgi:hypothetical protein
MAAQHKCSDFLNDRHPYYPENNTAHFADTVDPHQVFLKFYSSCAKCSEVCVAFLARGVPKLTDLLAYDEVNKYFLMKLFTYLL